MTNIGDCASRIMHTSHAYICNKRKLLPYRKKAHVGTVSFLAWKPLTLPKIDQFTDLLEIRKETWAKKKNENKFGWLISELNSCVWLISLLNSRSHSKHRFTKQHARQHIEIILSTKLYVYKYAIRSLHMLTQLDTAHANTIFAIAENCKLQTEAMWGAHADHMNNN